jgi:hypothetical protein
MTDYERIRLQFNAHAPPCRTNNQRPRLNYEPGCLYIECDLPACKCRLNDGDGRPVSAVLAEWQQRHAS